MVIAILLCAVAATAETKVSLGAFTPKAMPGLDSVINLNVTNVVADDAYSSTELTLDIAGAFSQLGQDATYQRYAVTVGRNYSIGNPEARVRTTIGGGAGLYRTNDGTETDTAFGAYAKATIDFGSLSLCVKYSDVKGSTTGDGWSVTTGIRF